MSAMGLDGRRHDDGDGAIEDVDVISPQLAPYRRNP